jgi:hypothetical protein
MPADPRFNGFFLTTGATFAAFASGFGVCLFNLDTVDACLTASQGWVDTFRAIGDHILQWGMAIVKGAFRF